MAAGVLEGYDPTEGPPSIQPEEVAPLPGETSMDRFLREFDRETGVAPKDVTQPTAPLAPEPDELPPREPALEVAAPSPDETSMDRFLREFDRETQPARPSGPIPTAIERVTRPGAFSKMTDEEALENIPSVPSELPEELANKLPVDLRPQAVEDWRKTSRVMNSRSASNIDRATALVVYTQKYHPDMLRRLPEDVAPTAARFGAELGGVEGAAVRGSQAYLESPPISGLAGLMDKLDRLYYRHYRALTHTEYEHRKRRADPDIDEPLVVSPAEWKRRYDKWYDYAEGDGREGNELAKKIHVMKHSGTEMRGMQFGPLGRTLGAAMTLPFQGMMTPGRAPGWWWENVGRHFAGTDEGWTKRRLEELEDEFDEKNKFRANIVNYAAYGAGSLVPGGATHEEWMNARREAEDRGLEGAEDFMGFMYQMLYDPANALSGVKFLKFAGVGTTRNGLKLIDELVRVRTLREQKLKLFDDATPLQKETAAKEAAVAETNVDVIVAADTGFRKKVKTWGIESIELLRSLTAPESQPAIQATDHLIDRLGLSLKKAQPSVYRGEELWAHLMREAEKRMEIPVVRVALDGTDAAGLAKYRTTLDWAAPARIGKETAEQAFKRQRMFAKTDAWRTRLGYWAAKRFAPLRSLDRSRRTAESIMFLEKAQPYTVTRGWRTERLLGAEEVMHPARWRSFERRDMANIRRNTLDRERVAQFYERLSSATSDADTLDLGVMLQEIGHHNPVHENLVMAVAKLDNIQKAMDKVRRGEIDDADLPEQIIEELRKVSEIEEYGEELLDLANELERTRLLPEEVLRREGFTGANAGAIRKDVLAKALRSVALIKEMLYVTTADMFKRERELVAFKDVAPSLEKKALLGSARDKLKDLIRNKKWSGETEIDAAMAVLRDIRESMGLGGRDIVRPQGPVRGAVIDNAALQAEGILPPGTSVQWTAHKKSVRAGLKNIVATSKTADVVTITKEQADTAWRVMEARSRAWAFFNELPPDYADAWFSRVQIRRGADTEWQRGVMDGSVQVSAFDAVDPDAAPVFYSRLEKVLASAPVTLNTVGEFREWLSEPRRQARGVKQEELADSLVGDLDDADPITKDELIQYVRDNKRPWAERVETGTETTWATDSRTVLNRMPERLTEDHRQSLWTIGGGEQDILRAEIEAGARDASALVSARLDSPEWADALHPPERARAFEAALQAELDASSAVKTLSPDSMSPAGWGMLNKIGGEKRWRVGLGGEELDAIRNWDEIDPGAEPAAIEDFGLAEWMEVDPGMRAPLEAAMANPTAPGTPVNMLGFDPTGPKPDWYPKPPEDLPPVEFLDISTHKTAELGPSPEMTWEAGDLSVKYKASDVETIGDLLEPGTRRDSGVRLFTIRRSEVPPALFEELKNVAEAREAVKDNTVRGNAPPGHFAHHYDEGHTGPDSVLASVPGPEGMDYTEITFSLKDLKLGESPYRSDHHDADFLDRKGIKYDDNIFLSIRLDTILEDGKKTLRILEIQSDLHGEGRKAGYGSEARLTEGMVTETEAYGEIRSMVSDAMPGGGAGFLGLIKSAIDGLIEGDETLSSVMEHMRGFAERSGWAGRELGDLENSILGVLEELGVDLADPPGISKGGLPSAPYKKSWQQAGFRRALKWAAENGHERIKWEGAYPRSEKAYATGGRMKPKTAGPLYDEKLPKEAKRMVGPRAVSGEPRKNAVIVELAEKPMGEALLGLSGQGLRNTFLKQLLEAGTATRIHARPLITALQGNDSKAILKIIGDLERRSMAHAGSGVPLWDAFKPWEIQLEELIKDARKQTLERAEPIDPQGTVRWDPEHYEGWGYNGGLRSELDELAARTSQGNDSFSDEVISALASVDRRYRRGRITGQRVEAVIDDLRTPDSEGYPPTGMRIFEGDGGSINRLATMLRDAFKDLDEVFEEEAARQAASPFASTRRQLLHAMTPDPLKDVPRKNLWLIDVGSKNFGQWLLDADHPKSLSSTVHDVAKRNIKGTQSNPDHWTVEITPEVRKKFKREGMVAYESAKARGGAWYVRGQIEHPRTAAGAYGREATGKTLSIISIFSKGDFTTIIHELGHLFRWDMNPRDRLAADSWIKETFGDSGFLTDGNWASKSEEAFAQAFVRYLKEGKIPEALAKTGIRDVFVNFKDWLRDVWYAVTGRGREGHFRGAGGELGPAGVKGPEIKITEEIRGVFDRLFDPRALPESPLSIGVRESKSAWNMADPLGKLFAGERYRDAISQLMKAAKFGDTDIQKAIEYAMSPDETKQLWASQQIGEAANRVAGRHFDGVKFEELTAPTPRKIRSIADVRRELVDTLLKMTMLSEDEAKASVKALIDNGVITRREVNKLVVTRGSVAAVAARTATWKQWVEMAASHYLDQMGVPADAPSLKTIGSPNEAVNAVTRARNALDKARALDAAPKDALTAKKRITFLLEKAGVDASGLRKLFSDGEWKKIRNLIDEADTKLQAAAVSPTRPDPNIIPVIDDLGSIDSKVLKPKDSLVLKGSGSGGVDTKMTFIVVKVDPDGGLFLRKHGAKIKKGAKRNYTHRWNGRADSDVWRPVKRASGVVKTRVIAAPTLTKANRAGKALTLKRRGEGSRNAAGQSVIDKASLVASERREVTPAQILEANDLVSWLDETIEELDSSIRREIVHARRQGSDMARSAAARKADPLTGKTRPEDVEGTLEGFAAGLTGIRPLAKTKLPPKGRVEAGPKTVPQKMAERLDKLLEEWPEAGKELLKVAKELDYDLRSPGAVWREIAEIKKSARAYGDYAQLRRQEAMSAFEDAYRAEALKAMSPDEVRKIQRILKNRHLYGVGRDATPKSKALAKQLGLVGTESLEINLKAGKRLKKAGVAKAGRQRVGDIFTPEEIEKALEVAALLDEFMDDQLKRLQESGRLLTTVDPVVAKKINVLSKRLASARTDDLKDALTAEIKGLREDLHIPWTKDDFLDRVNLAGYIPHILSSVTKRKVAALKGRGLLPRTGQTSFEKFRAKASFLDDINEIARDELAKDILYHSSVDISPDNPMWKPGAPFAKYANNAAELADAANAGRLEDVFSVDEWADAIKYARREADLNEVFDFFEADLGTLVSRYSQITDRAISDAEYVADLEDMFPLGKQLSEMYAANPNAGMDLALAGYGYTRLTIEDAISSATRERFPAHLRGEPTELILTKLGEGWRPDEILTYARRIGLNVDVDIIRAMEHYNKRPIVVPTPAAEYMRWFNSPDPLSGNWIMGIFDGIHGLGKALATVSSLAHIGMNFSGNYFSIAQKLGVGVFDPVNHMVAMALASKFDPKIYPKIANKQVRLGDQVKTVAEWRKDLDEHTAVTESPLSQAYVEEALGGVMPSQISVWRSILGAGSGAVTGGLVGASVGGPLGAAAGFTLGQWVGAKGAQVWARGAERGVRGLDRATLGWKNAWGDEVQGFIKASGSEALKRSPKKAIQFWGERAVGMTAGAAIGSVFGGPVAAVVGAIAAYSFPEYMKMMSGLNKSVEMQARLTMAVGEMRKGRTMIEASDAVDDALRNYSHLTPFERHALRRIFFFYTWDAGNIRFQLHNLVQNPRQAVIFKNFMNGIFKGQFSEEEIQSLPSNLRWEVMLRTGASKMWLVNGLPQQAAIEFLGRTEKGSPIGMITRLRPDALLAMEWGFGRQSLYYGKGWDEVNNVRQFKNAPPWIKYAVGLEVDDEGNPVPSARVKVYDKDGRWTGKYRHDYRSTKPRNYYAMSKLVGWRLIHEHNKLVQESFVSRALDEGDPSAYATGLDRAVSYTLGARPMMADLEQQQEIYAWLLIKALEKEYRAQRKGMFINISRARKRLDPGGTLALPPKDEELPAEARIPLYTKPPEE